MSPTLRLLLGVFLLFPTLLTAQKNRPSPQLEMTPLPAVPTMPDAFPQVVGTQAFGPAYKFTKDPAVLEAAKGISAMGSRILKIDAVSGGASVRNARGSACSTHDPSGPVMANR